MDTNELDPVQVFSKDDICDYELDGIDMADYPDFADAFILSACCKATGRELTQDELEAIDPGDIYDLVLAQIF
jgi:hypothetical protein